jgi:hypothetical protein
MKRLFIDISQDEKNRILEMHSIKNDLIEQKTTRKPKSTETTPVNQETNQSMVVQSANSNVDTTKTVKEVKVGTSINLYGDKEEKTQPTTYKVNKITNNFSNGVVMELNPAATLTFKCGIISLFLKTKTKDSNGKEIVKEKNVFNDGVYKDLKSLYCTTNKSGKSVPKVDYAMNNQQDTTNTGIA